jgi:hypothetical protein
MPNRFPVFTDNETQTQGTTNLGTVAITTNLSVSGNSTFGDNIADSVNCNGTLTAQGLCIYDATTVAIATSAVALPVTANVVTMTGASPVTLFTGGVLGAVYWLINGTGSNLTINHSTSAVCRGAANITLGDQGAAMCIVRSPNNVSIF